MNFIKPLVLSYKRQVNNSVSGKKEKEKTKIEIWVKNAFYHLEKHLGDSIANEIFKRCLQQISIMFKVRKNLNPVELKIYEIGYFYISTCCFHFSFDFVYAV